MLVEVDGSERSPRQTVILATGSVKRPIPGAEFGGRVIGTEEAWALPELPARLAVVGAGASGAEIASAYARLGSEVLLLEALDRVLPTEDADISRLVERGLKRQGMEVHTSTPVADVQGAEDGVTFSYGEETAEVDYLVIAAGRGADVEGLGLAEAGIELDESGLVQVDGALRTSRRASTRSATSSPAPRSRTRPPTRASSPPRTPPACRPTRSPTSTSRARPSARRTSAPSA